MTFLMSPCHVPFPFPLVPFAAELAAATAGTLKLNFAVATQRFIVTVFAAGEAEAEVDGVMRKEIGIVYGIGAWAFVSAEPVPVFASALAFALAAAVAVA